MARIPLVDPADPNADPHAAAMLNAPDAGVGLLNVQRAMANHPEAMEKFFELARVTYLDNSLDDPKLRELPYLTAAVANNCFY